MQRPGKAGLGSKGWTPPTALFWQPAAADKAPTLTLELGNYVGLWTVQVKNTQGSPLLPSSKLPRVCVDS